MLTEEWNVGLATELIPKCTQLFVIQTYYTYDVDVFEGFIEVAVFVHVCYQAAVNGFTRYIKIRSRSIHGQ